MKTCLGKGILCFAGAWLCAAPPGNSAAADARTDRFEALRLQVQREPAAVSDADYGDLLRLGRELGRPAAVSAAARVWLGTRREPSGVLLRESGDAAFLAGDLRTAVARYRQYLETAGPDPAAAATAVRVAHILLDYLRAPEEGYRFLDEAGAQYGNAPAMRRFDAGFMQRARETQDFPALARRLALIMARRIPIAQEHVLCWPHLEWLMAEISSAQPVHFPAAAACRQLAGLIRGNPAWAASMRFRAENLAFKAAAPGKEADVLEKEFGPVAAAARAYVAAAPTAATVRDVMMVFAGGILRFVPADWNAQLAQKRAVFMYAFDQVPDPEREALMDWTWANMHQQMATPEQWAQLGARHPALFKRAAATAGLTFVTQADSPAVFKQQAAFLEGVPSLQAAAINALAAADPDDLMPAVRHLLLKESWHLGPHAIWSVIHDSLRPAFQGYIRPADQALPATFFNDLHYTLGHTLFARSPWALLHPEVGRGVVLHGWTRSGTDAQDKSQFAEVLRAFAWVAYDEAQRRMIFGPAYEEFKQWAGTVRSGRDAAVKAHADGATPETEAARNAAEADLARIPVLEAEFQKAFDPKTVDFSQAPDPLSGHLSRTAAAAQARQPAAYLAAARETYAWVRTCDEQRTPFGRAVLEYLLQNRPGMDLIDWQAEVLADQTRRVTDPQAHNLAAHWTMSTIVATRNWNWGYFNMAEAEKIPALKINDALAGVLLEQISADRFWEPAFGWFRRTRRGHGWHEAGRNVEVLDRMIEQKTLLRPGAPTYTHAGAVPSYQWLIRSEFQPLNEKYPVEQAFDALFAEEIAASRRVDMAFFHYSHDRERKAANAITELFAGFERLPLGYDGGERLYDWATFWNAQDRLWNADTEVRDAALHTLGTYFGKTRFDSMTDGVHLFNQRPPPDTPAARTEWFAALNRHLAAIAPLPWRCTPVRMTPLAGFGPAGSYSDADIQTLERIVDATLPSAWPAGQHHETLGQTLITARVGKGRAHDAFVRIPAVWMIARDTRNGNFHRDLALLSGTLVEDGHADLGTALAVAGLEIMGTALTENLRRLLQGVRAQALADAGSILPVERADPRYPIYAAQAAYARGQLENAWEQYRARPALALSEIQDLDPGFTLWLVQRHTAGGEYSAAEALTRPLMQWMDDAPQAFDPETRAQLLLRVADIAFVQQEYPRARAQFERIALTQALDGTAGQRDADLRIAEVDRLTRNFDRAGQHLERLLMRRDPYLQAQAHYQLALIRFDQEDYDAVREHLDHVFTTDNRHAHARILEGRLHLQLRKLIEATRVRVGLAADQQTLTPGRPLRIEIEDRTLAVVRTAVAVEIRAWTGSGDEETFNLLPFGDSRTRFEGQLPTVLGAPNKGDRVLQVLGGDTVRFDFTDRFKAANGITESLTGEIRVVSDAELYASSGTILTREEQERRRLERQLLPSPAADGQARAALSTLRAGDQIKPGNPINVRVVDPDRSIRAQRDTLTVRVTTTSGDRVDRVPLTETGPHSGVFEGIVPTASAPATAFASDSQEGRDPNFVITGADYPPWIALGNNRRPKIFSVDLNSSVALGELVIRADVPGRRLRNFLLQTSINGREFDNLAAWPDALHPWDGAPRLEIARLAPGTEMPLTVAAFKDYLDTGHLAERMPKRTAAFTGTTVQWDQTAGGHASALGLTPTGPNSRYVARVSVHFFLPYRQTRVFRLEHTLPEDLRDPRVAYALTLNGTEQRIRGAAGTPVDISVRLDGGVHRMEIWFTAHLDAPPAWTLLCDTPAPPYMIPCPPDMFDIQLPAMAAAGFTPATVTTEASSETFTVTFPEAVQARVLRLLLLDFEGDAPALRRMEMTDADGETILPTVQDILELRNNDTLEIIPGDQLTVIYEDPSVVNPERRVLTERLRATFNDGLIHACFVESTVDAAGNRHARYVRMVRYRPGDPVSVLIHDPDLDVSAEPDNAVFRVQTLSGERRTLEAVESAPHSGVFIGRVFPVPHPPTRPSEIQVEGPEDLILSYRDEENTSPGIPWDRRAIIMPVVQTLPRLNVYNVSSWLLEEAEREQAAQAVVGTGQGEESVPVTRALAVMLPDAVAQTGETPPPVGMHRVPLVFEVIYPTIARSPESVATVYVQTQAGRAKQGLGPDAAFDPTVPGTLRLHRTPGNAPELTAPAGYLNIGVRGNPRADDPIEDGRFTFVVPLESGITPDVSYAAVPDQAGPPLPASLTVRGNDSIHIGFAWTDADAGTTNWLATHIDLGRDVWFDVMDRRYQTPVASAFVGENIHLRVLDPARDLTDGRDTLAVEVATASGVQMRAELTETFDTSGIFKGVLRLLFEGDPERPDGDHVVPVQYGDTVTLTYRPGGGLAPENRTIRVHQGADGALVSFTKRFADPEIAVQTQLTLAEAHFEQAKQYRALEQQELAQAVIARGRRLLEEAIRDNPATGYQAQAEYLLAELALEYAGESEEDAIRQRYYLEAIGRFSDLTASYPESAYAPRAQYKKALTYEMMGEIDAACEEYVKLSYIYPENELVAETIARLGQYFLRKGAEFEKAAEAQADPVDSETQRIQARDQYRTSAEVFQRLGVRFPDHPLAGRTQLLSGQSYIRAGELPRAIEIFEAMIAARLAEPDLIAQAMYWTADSYVKTQKLVEAYRWFTRLTWDYPESQWARYARGRLTEEALVTVATKEKAQQ